MVYGQRCCILFNLFSHLVFDICWGSIKFINESGNLTLRINGPFGEQSTCVNPFFPLALYIGVAKGNGGKRKVSRVLVTFAKEKE